MSIPVDLDRLADALADFGAGYLLSTDGTRVKVVTVEPVLDDGALVTAPSEGTSRNVTRNPLVTVLFPPPVPRGHSLIVDGTAVDDGAGFRITPGSAVLHRPAAHGDGPPAPGGCANDCEPLDGRH